MNYHESTQWPRYCSRITLEIKDARLNAAIEVNVLVQLAQLTTHPFVARALEAGKLRLHGWVHDIGTGETRGFDAGQGRFVRLDTEMPPIADVKTLERAVA